MKLSEMEVSNKEVLTCADVAEVLGCNPHVLHTQAVQRRELLGFPVIVIESRVKIPRRAFLKFMKGGNADG